MRFPPFDGLKNFAKSTVLRRLDQVGIWQLPQGEEMYRFYARRHTTTNMTPREIHEIGQSEVETYPR